MSLESVLDNAERVWAAFAFNGAPIVVGRCHEIRTQLGSNNETSAAACTTNDSTAFRIKVSGRMRRTGLVAAHTTLQFQ
jgi:hypothetical protein